ncbi:MAG: hypothetical protein RJB39_104 [Candidatus Parcubacteria bacterium]|jgi:hypothetical protein
MNILRNILRFGLIAILIGLLVFLSIKIFKLIPKAINNLASATVSLGELNDDKPATTTVVVQQPTPTTADGLNGVVIQPTPVNPVPVNPTPTTTTATPTPTQINQPTQPTYPTYQTNPTPTQTTTKYVYPTYTRYYYPAPVATTKNLKLVLTSIGIINSNGQYVVTNSFNSSDTVSVRFKILNEEGGATGPWTMRVVMPAAEYNDRTKILNNLSTIPGQSSYTAEARFTGIDMSQGNPTVYIYADPENQINESNENDNVLTVRLPNVQVYQPIYQYPINNNNSCYWQNGYYYCANNGYNNYNNGYNNSNQCYSASYGYYTCNTDNGWNNGQSGTPNLMISTIETGRMINGSFYQTTTIPYGERVAVRALVRNTGGYFNNSWSVRLAMNNQGTGYRELNSAYQSPLQLGGETYVYFEVDNLIRGNQTMTMTADAGNNVSEVDENDNSKTINVYIN